MTGRGQRGPGDGDSGTGGGGGRHVVIVESPDKAKTIAKYPGAGHRVIVTRGHVSDPPKKAGSFRPDEGFGMTYATARTLERNPI